MININERLAPPNEHIRKAMDAVSKDLRVAAPGIIQGFDAARQTVTVQTAIREWVVLDGVGTWTDIPVCVDVPIAKPRAGGYVLTFPIQAGDECLVVFGDRCMDAWWQSGGVQNQMDGRRHDLSDAYAILGVWSQPRTLPGYSTDAVQLRTDDGQVYLEIAPNGLVRIQANAVHLHADSHFSWDVYGYGEKVKHLGGNSWEITTWKEGADVTNVSKAIAPPENTEDEEWPA